MAQILMVEDEPALLKVFSKWLEGEGHEVTRVGNGLQGLRTATLSGKPDLLVTDIMMPVCDGEELAVSFELIAPGTPILVVTASADQELLARLRNEPSIREVLPKPVTREILVSAVTRALSGQG